MWNNYYYPYIDIYITVRLLKQNIKYIKHINYYYKDLIYLDNDLEDILKLEDILTDINKLPSVIKKPVFKVILDTDYITIDSSSFKTTGNNDTLKEVNIFLYDNTDPNNPIFLLSYHNHEIPIIIDYPSRNRNYYIEGNYEGNTLGTSIMSDKVYFNV